VALAEGPIEHSGCQGTDPSRAPGKWYELVQWDQPTLGMVPAHQRLHPIDAPRPQSQLELVAHSEPILLSRLAELDGQRQPVGTAVVMLRRIYGKSAIGQFG
jgi:hypothetical protein